MEQQKQFYCGKINGIRDQNALVIDKTHFNNSFTKWS